MSVAATPAAPQAPCGWPIIDFVAEPAQLRGVLAEGELHRARFDAVVQIGRGAVIVEVADVARIDAASFIASVIARAGSSPDSSSRTR